MCVAMPKMVFSLKYRKILYEVRLQIYEFVVPSQFLKSITFYDIFLYFEVRK
jgi:hypothetical protein